MKLKNKNSKKEISKCCKKPVKVGGKGTTHYYVCTKCKQACDVLRM